MAQELATERGRSRLLPVVGRIAIVAVFVGLSAAIMFSSTHSALAPRALEAMSPIFLAAFGWLSTAAARFFSTRVENERTAGVIVRVNDAVLTAVREIQQTVVAEAKARSADGKLSPDDRARMREAAIVSAKLHLGSQGLRALQDLIGLDEASVHDVLGKRVEATICTMKTADDQSAPNRAAAGAPLGAAA